MTELTFEELQAADALHVWHPYASAAQPPEVFPIVSAAGVRLKMANGEELIDGMASWWCAIHGYNHPVLNEAVSKQLQSMSHVMFGGLTHPPAVHLAKKLVELTPPTLDRVFFSDSGSVAVEVALKMALQYWHSQGKPQKQKLVALKNGYHGDTFGAMSVCDPITGMHHLFGKALPKQYFASAPDCNFHGDCSENDFADMRALVEKHAQELAAVIVEPVVQGAGGMRFYSPDYLRKLRALCDEQNVLLICDEIATGFGRTGKMFACEHAGISPDILCLGKALTGGYMTLAATLCTDRVASTISAGEAGAFMHGPTFMANPLACATALASIELLEGSDWERSVERVGSRLAAGLSSAAELPQVNDVRTLGAIGVIELKAPVDMAHVQPMFVERGVWIRPFGKLVYTMPAYIMSDSDIETITGAMIDVVSTL